MLFLYGSLKYGFKAKERLRTWNIKEIWSGRKDSNLRPLQPHCSALPSCATPRQLNNSDKLKFSFKERG